MQLCLAVPAVFHQRRSLGRPGPEPVALGFLSQSRAGEAQALLQQLAPDRLPEFSRHHERPKARREVTAESYCIEDYLQGLQFPRANPKDRPLGREAAIPHFQQQVAILDAAGARLDSVLFDLRQALQLELLAAEIDLATRLVALGAPRAAGALAGLMLERHLLQVCRSRRLIAVAATPDVTISALAEALRAAQVLDLPQCQFVQHLGELRALCDVGRMPEPTPDQVNDLITGTRRALRLVF